MENVKIDEEYLEKFCIHINELIKIISSDVLELENKKNDPFIRYLCFFRLKSVFDIIKEVLLVVKSAFKLGYDLNHPFLLTEEAKKCGWGNYDVASNPFFENDELELLKKTKQKLEEEIENRENNGG